MRLNPNIHIAESIPTVILPGNSAKKPSKPLVVAPEPLIGHSDPFKDIQDLNKLVFVRRPFESPAKPVSDKE